MIRVLELIMITGRDPTQLDPSPLGWYKWNVDASRVECMASTTICIIYIDSMEKLLERKRSRLGTVKFS